MNIEDAQIKVQKKLNAKDRTMLHQQRETGRLWDSSDNDSSSEEDFAFLDAIANGKRPMTEIEAKLIQGVVAAPLKDKKRWDAKRMAADAANASFHSSDEEAELDKQAEKLEYDELLAQMHRNKKKVGAIEGDADATDGKGGLTREEQLRQMGRQAQNFDFYTMENTKGSPNKKRGKQSQA